MSWAIWITGLPGSGKSVIAAAAAEALRVAGERVAVLELDAIRRLLTPDPGASDGERTLVHRALVWVAATLTEAGVPVLINATAHRREWRDLARASIIRFAEVQLCCPIDICRERRAGRVESGVLSGVSYSPEGLSAVALETDAYEAAVAPELEIDTTAVDVMVAARRVARLAATLSPPPRPRTAPGPSRWAIWITGLPGSGKTTIASAVTAALAGRGVAVHILSSHEAQDFVLAGRPVSAQAEEVVHQALVYTATQLTESGIPVIIDATAPHRAWRDEARQRIGHFGEVQLLCPVDICATRERAVRWQLTGCAPTLGRQLGGAAGPDIVLGYEPSFRAELTIHTDVEGVWVATEAVVGLARRLDEAASPRRAEA